MKDCIRSMVRLCGLFCMQLTYIYIFGWFLPLYHCQRSIGFNHTLLRSLVSLSKYSSFKHMNVFDYYTMHTYGTAHSHNHTLRVWVKYPQFTILCFYYCIYAWTGPKSRWQRCWGLIYICIAQRSAIHITNRFVYTISVYCENGSATMVESFNGIDTHYIDEGASHPHWL